MTHKFDPQQVLKLMQLKSGMMIADIGCGTGFLTVPLARIVGQQVKASFALAAAENLSFRNDCFDAILSTTIVCFVNSPRAVIGEIDRVLKSGVR